MDTAVKIYTAFSSAGLFGSSQTYPLHHPDEKVLSNEEMLSEIRRRCEGVEFVGATEVENPERTVANVQARRRSLDGLLYFGSLLAGSYAIQAPQFPLQEPDAAIDSIAEPPDVVLDGRLLTSGRR